MYAATSGETTRNIGFIAFTTVVATLGGFLFGFDSGVINGTVDGLQIAFNASDFGQGFNVASMLLGCAVGAFFAGRVADIYGRRLMLIVAAVFFIVSAYGSGIATSSFEFIIYRIIGGIAVGAASVLAPAYISEIAPAAIRGRLASVQQIAIIFGLFSAFLSNYLLAKHAGASTARIWWEFEAWRWMFWMELIPAVLFLFALFLIPESPRFQVLKGRENLALATLTRLFGSESAKQSIDEIRDSFNAAHTPRFADIIDSASKKIKPIIWIGIGLATFQQLVGINVVFYYGAVLWQSAGFTESDALLINVISGAVSILACLITFTLIDKLGRKPFLTVGSIGMTITLAVMAFVFAQAALGDDGNLQLSDTGGLVALISANLYVFFFNFSWGPVMWIALGEMFPNQIRGIGLAIAGLFQWGSNFLITMTFPILLSSIGLSGAYGIYAFFSLISIIFVINMVVETKGVKLEDMESITE